MMVMMIDTNLGIYHVASEKAGSLWGKASVTLQSFPRLIQPDPTHPTPPSPVVWGLSTQTDRHRHRHRHTDIQLQTHHSSSSSTPSSQSRSLRFQQEGSLGVALKWRRLNRFFNSPSINWKRWNNKITTECLSLTNYSARGRDPPPVPIIPHVFLIPW